MSHRQFTAALVAVGLVAVAASAHPATPVETSSQTCEWTPAGPVNMLVGEKVTFGPVGGGCSGYTATISPTDGGAGFDVDCTAFSDASPLFPVFACAPGGYTMTIDDGSSVVQVIDISVDVP